MVSVDKKPGSSSGDNMKSNVAFTGPVLTNWSDTSGQLNITVVSPELVVNQQYSVNISIDTAEAGSLSTMTHFGEWGSYLFCLFVVDLFVCIGWENVLHEHDGGLNLWSLAVILPRRIHKLHLAIANFNGWSWGCDH